MSRIKRTSSISNTRQKKQHGRVNKYYGLYIGIVKDNTDSAKMGRLLVHIPDLNSDPNDRSTWFLVNYCTPFGGVTNDEEVLGNDFALFEQTQSSYGMWFVPPDKNNLVAVMFANGDPSKGYWFGSIYHQYMNNMVPGIPSNNSPQGESVDREFPVSEYNRNFDDGRLRPQAISRPFNKTLTQSLGRQGLIDDSVRGFSRSGARRESPSQVYGILTPGKKLDGGIRTGGHQFVLDDEDEFIRIRTIGGSQVKLDDKNDLIYIINSQGSGWVQIDRDGKIDVFGKDSISVRSQQDVNFRADRDVNIEAGRNLNLKSAKTHTDSGSVSNVGEGSGGNINLESEFGNLNVLSENIVYNSESFEIEVNDDFVQNINGSIIIETDSFEMQSDGVDINAISGGTIFGTSLDIGGGTVNLVGTVNMGPGNITQPIVSADVSQVVNIQTFDKTNVLSDFDGDTDYLSNKETENVQTITSRFVTQEPYPEHTIKKQGE